MATAFGLLRLSPKSFWSMTPRELERAMSVLRTGAGEAPARADVAALMRRFPDIKAGDGTWLKTSR